MQPLWISAFVKGKKGKRKTRSHSNVDVVFITFILRKAVFYPSVKWRKLDQTLRHLGKFKVRGSKTAHLWDWQARLLVRLAWGPRAFCLPCEVKRFGLQIKPAGQVASRSQGQTNNPSLLMMREKPQGRNSPIPALHLRSWAWVIHGWK